MYHCCFHIAVTFGDILSWAEQCGCANCAILSMAHGQIVRVYFCTREASYTTNMGQHCVFSNIPIGLCLARGIQRIKSY